MGKLDIKVETEIVLLELNAIVKVKVNGKEKKGDGYEKICIGTALTPERLLNWLLTHDENYLDSGTIEEVDGYRI